MERMEELPFVIESDEVTRLQTASGLSLEDFLGLLVEPTRSLARPPVSKFHVGAVGLGSSGRVFRGVNVEFAGLPLNFSIHAEQFLVANAARNGEHRLKFLAVSAAPCGHCRQFLQELRGAEDIRVLIADEKAETQPLSYFLPHRFGPQDLLEDDFPLLLEKQTNNLHFLEVETLAMSKSLAVHSAHGNAPSAAELSRLLQGTDLNGLTHDDENDDEIAGQSSILASLPNFVAKHLIKSPAVAQQSPLETVSQEQGLAPDQLGELQRAVNETQQVIQLRNAALLAANSSYAPYTNSPSGLAFSTKKGGVYSGPYFESAAYNPSLPPLQTAIVAFIAEGGESFEEISKVVLVEKEGAPVRQEAVIRLALQHISPEASLQVVQARSS